MYSVVVFTKAGSKEFNTTARKTKGANLDKVVRFQLDRGYTVRVVGDVFDKASASRAKESIEGMMVEAGFSYVKRGKLYSK